MNEEEIRVRVTADIKDYVNSMQKVSTSTVASGFVIGNFVTEAARRVIQFGKDCFIEFGKSESAILRLQKAVGTNATKAFVDFSNAMQEATGYSNTAIIALQNQLTNFGVLPGSINEATKAIIDYAAATGRELPEAGSMFTRALTGNARELKQMGLELISSDTKSQNLAKTIGFLTTKFGGTAEMMKGTVEGSLRSFNSDVESLQESIGEFLGKDGINFIGWLDDIIKKDTKAIDVIKQTTKEVGWWKTIAGAVAEFGNELAGVDENSADYNRRMSEMLSVHGKLAPAQKRTKEEQEKLNNANEKGVKTYGELSKAGEERISQLKKSLLDEESIQKDITKINELETEKRVLSARNSFERTASFSQKLRVDLETNTKEWSTIFVNSFDTMTSSLSSNVTDMIFEGKKLKDALSDTGKEILRQFVEQVIQKMVAQWAAGLVTMGNASDAFRATEAAKNAGTTTPGTGTPGGGAVNTAANILGGAGVNIAARDLAMKEYGDSSSGKAGVELGTAFPGVFGTSFGGGAVGDFINDKFGSHTKNYSPEERIIMDVGTWLNRVMGDEVGWASWNNIVTTLATRKNLSADIIEKMRNPMWAIKNWEAKIPGIGTGDAKNYTTDIIFEWLNFLESQVVKTEYDAVPSSWRNALLASGLKQGGMAEGGIVKATPGGTFRLLGEGGKDEAVIPLDKANGLGMTVNITINGTFLEADQTKWDKLVREKIVVPLERMRLKTANSVI